MFSCTPALSASGFSFASRGDFRCTSNAPPLASAVNDPTSTAQDKFNEMVEQDQERCDKLEVSIRRNRLQAAGIAAGIGFLLALLARH